MMEYKRLTKGKWTNENCKPVYDKNGDIVMDRELFDLLMTEHNRLAELEDKIEQGTLKEIPCNVGDTVYRITQLYRSAEKITPYIVKEIIIDKKGFSYLTLALKGAQSITCKIKLETVFLTREEAEKRLQELQNG